MDDFYFQNTSLPRKNKKNCTGNNNRNFHPVGSGEDVFIEAGGGCPECLLNLI
jgi:hypothetical protein